MKYINTKLLPIKSHYFFFMGSIGPIFPQLQVIGKEQGISSVVMGTITGILPLITLICKSIFGLVLDTYKKQRKLLFICLICLGGISFLLLYIIPTRTKCTNKFQNNFCDRLNVCQSPTFNSKEECSFSRHAICTSSKKEDIELPIQIHSNLNTDCYSVSRVCTLSNISDCNPYSNYTCAEVTELDQNCMNEMWQFWTFFILMSIGTVCFYVGSSVADAVCFELIGQDDEYGKQRLWGTLGWGISALISGSVVDLFSEDEVNYLPAFIIVIIFLVFDIISCIKLRFPQIKKPENLFKDVGKLMNTTKTKVFLFFAICSGVSHGYIINFLFWYLEDLAIETQTENIKLLEGVMISAGTLFSETLVFLISGKVLEKLGHANCFSLCFLFKGIRFAMLSIADNPWWVCAIEVVMQGPVYALTYSTVVAYANAIAPPGASTTMQAIVVGMNDCLGYAIGSIAGGFLLKYVGPIRSFHILSAFGFTCCVSHFILQKTLLRDRGPQNAITGNNGDISMEEKVQ